MKRKALIIVAMACCAALAFALAGCGQQEPEPDPEPEVSDTSAAGYSTDPFYVLVVGNDSRTGTTEIKKKQYADGNARSDTMMLVRVDPTTHLVTVLSIPRDTMTTVDGETVKINEAYNRHGIDGSIEQVELLTGVRPKYYLDTGFVGFEDLVDGMGGVPTDVAVDMQLKDIVHGDNISLSAGEQVLDGQQALVYARVRKIFVNMDSTRQYHDRELIINMIRKVLDNPGETATYLGAFAQNVSTNMSADELAFYVNDFIEHKDEVRFYSGSGPAEGGIDPATQLWLADRNEALWADIIAVTDEGGDPNTVYSSPIG